MAISSADIVAHRGVPAGSDARGLRSAASLPPNETASVERLMTPEDLAALPSLEPDRRIAYGIDSSQYGELRIPAGTGPYPLVVLIHGGCFKAAYATAHYFGAMADTLKADGIATWNIEYRRLGEPGSGWPGTYLDVGRAVDHVRTIAGGPPQSRPRRRRRALRWRTPGDVDRRTPSPDKGK